MKALLLAALATSAFASPDPSSPVMLAGPWLPEDPHQLDFFALPKVPSEHVVINKVTAKVNDPTELDKKKGGVNQHNYLAAC